MFAYTREALANKPIAPHAIRFHPGRGKRSGFISTILRNVVFPVDTCVADGTDMDLVALCPDLASARIARASMRQRVWIYAEISGEDVGRLARPIVWNDCGVMVFFASPHHSRNERGWVNVHGNRTTAPLVELSWFTFVRDLWMRSHKATLGGPGGRRVASPSYHGLFLPLMGQVRGWQRPRPHAREALLAATRRWALHTLAAGLQAAGATPQPTAVGAPGPGRRPSAA